MEPILQLVVLAFMAAILWVVIFTSVRAALRSASALDREQNRREVNGNVDNI